MVDGVSSIGGMPFRFDEWGIDVAVTASQKCLMSSPGIAFVALK
jgi:alanine-glyoxylate transaminase/serine-glyoxylate transaminase/serine-pyruvate transaminase